MRRYLAVAVLVAVLVVVVAVVVYAAVDASSVSESHPGRYSVMCSNNDSWLLDTQTGRTWRAIGDRGKVVWREMAVEGLSTAKAPEER